MPTRPPIFQADARRREYQRTRADPYTSRWDRVSRAYRRQHTLCIGCLAVGDTTSTFCTDHIVPHKGNPFLMWHHTNLQPLCRWHHDVIKQQLELMHMRGEIVEADLRIDSPIAMKLTREQR